MSDTSQFTEWQKKYDLSDFDGKHVFGDYCGHPHCIYCGKWRGESEVGEKCYWQEPK